MALSLTLAGACLGLATLHIVLLTSHSHRQGHGWAALGNALVAVLASLEHPSVTEHWNSAMPLVWAVAMLAMLPVMVMLAAELFGEPLRRWRWSVASGFVLLNVPLLAITLVVITTGTPFDWMTLRLSGPHISIPHLVSNGLFLAIWLTEAVRTASQRRTIAVSYIASALVACVLATIDGWTLFGISPFPPLIPSLWASPIILTASLAIATKPFPPETSTDLPYRNMRKLGSGGMGEVWLAVRQGNAGFLRWVVIKKIRLDKAGQQLTDRFLTEARVAARLQHPNIVSVYDLDRTDAGWFLVMEYLPGPSLWDIMHRCYELRSFAPVGIVASIGEQICRGLACAHGHSVMHRDISPDNVIVTFNGVVKLLDFGIAKVTRSVVPTFTGTFDDDQHTALGGVVGKAQYLAPERLIGADASPESDLYSVGLVLVQLLGAPIPNVGAALADRERPVSNHRPETPAALETIIVRSLASEPWARYRNALDMAQDLRRIAAAHPHQDMGLWIRELVPERFDVQRRLERMTRPSPERVQKLFDEAERQRRRQSNELLSAPAFPQPSSSSELSLSLPAKPVRPAPASSSDSMPTVALPQYMQDKIRSSRNQAEASGHQLLSTQRMVSTSSRTPTARPSKVQVSNPKQTDKIS